MMDKDSFLARFRSVSQPLGMNVPGVKQIARLLGTTLFFYDFETTGFVAPGMGIVEAGCILVSRNGSIRSCESVINPEAPIDPGAERVHGISAFKASKYPPWNNFFAHLFLRSRESGHLFAGYNNLKFDRNVLAEVNRRYEFDTTLPVREMDVMSVSKHIQKKVGVKSKALGSMTEFFGIQPDGDFHRALTDTKATILLAEKYVEMLGIRKFLDLALDSSLQERESLLSMCGCADGEEKCAVPETRV